MRIACLAFIVLSGCNHVDPFVPFSFSGHASADTLQRVAYKEGTWEHFLQHLPTSRGSVVDYRGIPVRDQSKHTAIVNYDVGTKDLQQCADALIRLRSEYLFRQNRHREIGFHFTSGDFFSWDSYCQGWRPVIRGNSVKFGRNAAPCEKTHQALRKYLDIVYTYAGTVSLSKELKAADRFETGVVIITPGSPGHTCIIVDEAVTATGDTVYKLAESYMPAQSIYILSNPHDLSLSPWYHLQKGMIVTSSYTFRQYGLKKF